MSGTPTVVEGIKAGSGALRGSLADELANGETFFTPDATHLIKFHGFYQQDDRDIRRARAAKKLPLDYSCMVRASIPAGRVTADQWIAMDDLASAVADGSLRITTRQGIQFHFVHKPNLRTLIGTLNRHLVTTLAACGDVVRNVMACPSPHAERTVDLTAYANELSRAFKPTTRAYYELFVDHEAAVSAVDPTPDPLYGETYLPRKFKIAFTWPGDNCVDLYAHDLGFVPVLTNGTHGDHVGWFVFAGGGMGQSHAREEDTYPRLASYLGTVPVDGLRAIAEAVIGSFRDNGDRTDRARARLKYAIDDRGLEWFIGDVRSRIVGTTTLTAPEDSPALPHWNDSDEHLGWHQATDGTWFLGVHVESGRVRDAHDANESTSNGDTRDRSATTHGRVRTALRALAESGLVNEFRMTARQDVLLCGVRNDDRVAIEDLLRNHDVPLAHVYSPVRRLGVACPALPTCGQALTEAERALPTLIDAAEQALDKVGIAGQALRINMTGCPNGCARPYTSEIGIVGRTKKGYDIYVGGSVGGERLNQRLAADVHVDDIPQLFTNLFAQYVDERVENEGFGDWSSRRGTDALASAVPIASPRRRKPAPDED